MPTAAELLIDANVLLERARAMLSNVGPVDDGTGRHYSDSPGYLAAAATWVDDLAAYLAL